jgi:hypothetical protein
MSYSKQSRMLLLAAILLLSIAGCGSLKNAAELKTASSLPEPKIFDKLETIPSLNARVAKLVFFGTGPADIAPLKSPTYKNRFEHAVTTKVHPEIHLDYGAPGKKVYFTMTVHIRENGRTFRIVDHESRIEPDWTSSNHSIGIGVFGPGTWHIGTYEADVYINGEKVATGYFEIY